MSKLKNKIFDAAEQSDALLSAYSTLSRIKCGMLRVLTDEQYITMKYKSKMGSKPNIENPVTFNEKLQWLKLYCRNPLYTQLVDKYKVREYVAEKIGDEYLNELYGAYDSFDEIDFDKLPEKFVLKCNHDCGSIEICTDKSTFDYARAKKELSTALKYNYYWVGREWPYKNVPRKIIAEQFLVDESGEELKDYKFFCFNGEVKLLFIATDRNKKTTTYFDFFDAEFNHLPFTNGHPNSPKALNKPATFEKMIELAEKLSKGIPFVRVDFYSIYEKVYFGEMTFFHWGGMMRFDPPEWDKTLGSWIHIETSGDNAY